MASFRFFTSYAHADADDDLLRTFYLDLAADLKSKGAKDEEFLDMKNITSGEEWRRSLEGALGSSRCLLALYSPAYFASPDCGKEVAAFELRLQDFQRDPTNAGSALVPPLLIGVLWQSEIYVRNLMPSVLSKFQYGVPHFQENPLKDDRTALNRTAEVQKIEKYYGLRYVMKLKDDQPEYAAHYVDIVNRYAAQIISVTRQFDLSKYQFPGDYKTLIPAFPNQLSPAEAAAPTTSNSRKGPKFVRVLFIVGRPDSFAALNERKNLNGYADDPRLWQPFLPDDDDEIGPVVGRAVALEKMNAEFVSTSTGLDPATLNQIVDNAARDNNVLVVIIDPWSVYIPTLQPNLSALDKRRNAYGSMFLCWNEKDPDTTAKAKDLEAELEKVFDETTQDNASLLSEIRFRSPQHLEDQLRAKITLIKNKILQRLARQGQIRPLPAGTPLPSTPVPSR